MNINQVVEKLTNFPKYMEQGAGKLSLKFHCNREDIYTAKAIVRNKRNFGTEYHPKDVAFKPKVESQPKRAKILLIDIETSPILTWTFQTKKAYIQPEQIERDFSIMTYAAKWLNDDNMISGTSFNEEDFDDFNVTEEIWGLLDEADVVVAHNLNRFDRLKINARFLYWGLTPPSPYKCVDTLQIAKYNFGTTYKKLDFLSKFIGSEGKMEHEGFEMWKKCMHGDEESWNNMLAYNKVDVLELEKVYLALRPFDSRHPSVSIYNETPDFCCTKCGSKNIEYKKDTFTNTKVFKLYQCNDCNGWSRSRVAESKSKVLMTQ